MMPKEAPPRTAEVAGCVGLIGHGGEPPCVVFVWSSLADVVDGDGE
jgi:hypothetical protein